MSAAHEWHWQERAERAEAEVVELRAANRELLAACERLASIATPEGAPDGTWVAETIYCNRQITVADVLAARAAIAKART